MINKTTAYIGVTTMGTVCIGGNALLLLTPASMASPFLQVVHWLAIAIATVVVPLQICMIRKI